MMMWLLWFVCVCVVLLIVCVLLRLLAVLDLQHILGHQLRDVLRPPLGAQQASEEHVFRRVAQWRGEDEAAWVHHWPKVTDIGLFFEVDGKESV